MRWLFQIFGGIDVLFVYQNGHVMHRQILNLRRIHLDVLCILDSPVTNCCVRTYESAEWGNLYNHQWFYPLGFCGKRLPKIVLVSLLRLPERNEEIPIFVLLELHLKVKRIGSPLYLDHFHQQTEPMITRKTPFVFLPLAGWY